jgi:hypothetical protein
MPAGSRARQSPFLREAGVAARYVYNQLQLVDEDRPLGEVFTNRKS